MEGNSECHICYEHKSCDKFKTLVCNHKLCYGCYKKLLQKQATRCIRVQNILKLIRDEINLPWAKTVCDESNLAFA